MGKCRILLSEILSVNQQRKMSINSLPFSHISNYLSIYCSICKFFVEEPGVSREDAFPTGPPEVLVFTSHMNVTNESLSDIQGENSGGNKFYLPVSLTVCWNEYFFFAFAISAVVKLYTGESLQLFFYGFCESLKVVLTQNYNSTPI